MLSPSPKQIVLDKLSLICDLDAFVQDVNKNDLFIFKAKNNYMTSKVLDSLFREVPFSCLIIA